MAVNTDPLRRDTVQVVARDTGDRFGVGNSDPALRLAGSLAELVPTLQGAAQAYIGYQTEEQGALAKKAAIEASGATLADAVRDGKIKPTQNPFFIQAYNTEAAAVSGRTALTQLQLDSQTWEERNDPPAFAKRWGEEVAKVGEKYSGVDEAKGFAAVAGQASQQVLATNQAYNSQRIEAERVQNQSSILATDIAAKATSNGGSVTPAQLSEDLKAAYGSWHGTGGSDEGWNKMVTAAVTSAAYQSHNPDLIDLLKDPSLSADGKTNIYGIAGIADAAESDRYRISQAADYAATGRLRQIEAGLKVKGQQGLSDLYANYGTAITLGNVSVQDMNNFLIGKGYNPQEAAASISAVGSFTSGIAAAQNARLTINSTDPAQSASVLDLTNIAITSGYNPQLAEKVKSLVLSGDLKREDATAIISRAMSRSEHFESEGRADQRQAASDARRNAAEADNKDVKALKDLRQKALNVGARAARNVTVIQGRGTYAPPALAKEAQQVSVAAAQGWLAKAPGDYNGAATAAFDAVEAWGHGKIGNRAHKAGSSGRR